jgi:hypothetical protein
MPKPLEKKPKETKVHEAFIFTYQPAEKQKHLDRYWSRIDKRGPDDCWEFYGCILSNGYGLLPIGKSGRPQRLEPRAHRLAWVIKYNMLIPKGLCVCHRCDNKICCNPSHLFLGTIKTNLVDMHMKKKLNRLNPKKHTEKKQKEEKSI